MICLANSVACRHTPGSQPSICLTLLHYRYHDEGPLAHDIARHNGGIDLTPVRCEETPPHWRLDQFHSWHHAPCLMPYNGPWYEGILEHAAQDGNAVMLTGFGGNFSWSFSGEYDVLGLLQRGQLGNAARLVRAHGNASQRSLFRIFLSLALKPLLLRYAFPVLQGIFGPNRVPDWPAYSVLRPEFARATGALARATNAGTIQFLRGVPIASQRFRCKALQGRDWAADWGAALQAKYGVVMRDPTADVELVRFCLALPSEQYLNNGMQRSIAKRAVADLLPHEILHTRQRGYQSGDWLRRFDMGIAKMRTDLELFAQSPLTCQLLDLPRLRSSLDRWPQVDRSAPATFREYFIAVTTGFQIGRFIHWVEQSHA